MDHGESSSGSEGHGRLDEEPRRQHSDTTISPQDSVRSPWAESPTIANPPRVENRKRSLSNTILAKLNLLKPVEQDSSKEGAEKEPKSPRSPKSPRFRKVSIATDGAEELAEETSPTSPESATPVSDKLQGIKQRKRKGSLRKTALLGGRRFNGEPGRKNSLLQWNVSTDDSKAPLPTADREEQVTPSTEDVGLPAEIKQHIVNAASSTSPSGTKTEPAAVTEARLALLAAQHASQSGAESRVQGIGIHAATLSSPSDPRSPTSYASTTEDDDESLSFSRPSTGVSSTASIPVFLPPPDQTATSYFPPTSLRASRPRSSQRIRPSPLQHAYAPAPEPYSYTETEYWGWVILFTTWLVFTVGMGSCLDIWSWAWDVGETPYAPPELEDDPTLPIVGYYPALIVLTGVVAWIWITVAWVGMKYFRHAKMEI